MDPKDIPAILHSNLPGDVALRLLDIEDNAANPSVTSETNVTLKEDPHWVTLQAQLETLEALVTEALSSRHDETLLILRTVDRMVGVVEAVQTQQRALETKLDNLPSSAFLRLILEEVNYEPYYLLFLIHQKIQEKVELLR